MFNRSVKILWWRFAECDPHIVRAYINADDRAQADFDLVQEANDGKRWELVTVTAMLGDKDIYDMIEPDDSPCLNGEPHQYEPTPPIICRRCWRHASYRSTP